MKRTLSLAVVSVGAGGLVAMLTLGEAPSKAAELNRVEAGAVLTPAQVKSDLALAKEAFERVHPGYTRYASEADMKAAWASILTKAQADGGIFLPRSEPSAHHHPL